ncbi:acyltransferase [Bradyrhizobium sp. UFLA03-84]|uniref:acyltransferase family protein n=1 Tax=Bradyrhizobium sp. UFLA03-84 TaxID=418599 RepID=UPI001FD9011F|nr:acyltransferase [Bradyrhizobium sp. UFLA03-84]
MVTPNPDHHRRTRLRPGQYLTLPTADVPSESGDQAINTARHDTAALDGLRAISICLVLAAHLFPLGPKSLQLNSTAGPMGMSLFFALSGYLIIRTLRAASVLEFVVKRISRILPLAYLYLALVFLAFGLSRQAMLYHLGFILNYRTDQMIPVTEHLWSLCVEVHFYIFVTALAGFAGRKSLIVVWPCCVAITAIRILQNAPIEIATHLRIDEILIGACVATLPLRRLGASTSLFAWSIAAALWAASSHPESNSLQYFRPYATGLLLWATLSQPPNKLIVLLSSKPLSYVATISYALYIFHPLTAHGWWADGSISQRYLLKRPIGLAIALLAAHLSTFYWERLWIQAARRHLNSRRAPKRSADSVRV